MYEAALINPLRKRSSVSSDAPRSSPRALQLTGSAASHHGLPASHSNPTQPALGPPSFYPLRLSCRCKKNIAFVQVKTQFIFFTAADCSRHQRHRATIQSALPAAAVKLIAAHCARPCPRRATHPAATHAHGRLPPGDFTRVVVWASARRMRAALYAAGSLPRGHGETRGGRNTGGGGERDGGRWRLAPRRRRDGAPLSSLDPDGTIRWPALRSVHSVERRGEVVEQEQGIDNTRGVGF